jgi:hypothetical protein
MPRSLRMMEGFGVHTFRLLNAAGESTFVKFHWRPKLGIQSTVWDEAVKLQAPTTTSTAATCSSPSRRATSPSGSCRCSSSPRKRPRSFPFDHLDPPSSSPKSWCRCNLLAAWCSTAGPTTSLPRPSRWPSAPPTCARHRLQQRPAAAGPLFSYLDTQLTRLGGPNFRRSRSTRRCPFHNNQRDGAAAARSRRVRQASSRFRSRWTTARVTRCAASRRSLPTTTGDQATAVLRAARRAHGRRRRHIAAAPLPLRAALLERGGVRSKLPSGEADPGIVLGTEGKAANAVADFITALGKHRHPERETGAMLK